jgi:chromatin remodeling complex protein RSC6
MSKKIKKQDDENFSSTYAECLEQINKSATDIKEIKTVLVQLGKIHAKEIKTLTKSKRLKNPDAPLHGFAAATPVPKDIVDFLGLQKGKKLPRTKICHLIYEYINDNGLKDKKNKKIIHADKKLKKLFKMKEGEQLTFDEFQKFLSRAYSKKEDSDSSSSDEDEPNKVKSNGKIKQKTI